VRTTRILTEYSPGAPHPPGYRTSDATCHREPAQRSRLRWRRPPG